jgi:hypothetical protein
MESTDNNPAIPAAKPAEPELSWSDLLAAYRLGPKDRWSGRLLDRLGPWLTSARKTLFTVPARADSDDVAQQLVLEVLVIAARWVPQCEDRWIPRKLVEAAARRTRCKLQRERETLSDELDLELAASDDPEPTLVFDTPIGNASAADLDVLYRYEVLGERLEAMAQKAGVTPGQMRYRLRAARKRARA